MSSLFVYSPAHALEVPHETQHNHNTFAVQPQRPREVLRHHSEPRGPATSAILWPDFSMESGAREYPSIVLELVNGADFG